METIQTSYLQMISPRLNYFVIMLIILPCFRWCQPVHPLLLLQWSKYSLPQLVVLPLFYFLLLKVFPLYFLQ